jgi:hypothetical protein
MSSIIKLPAANRKQNQTRGPSGTRSVFHLKIDGNQIEGFIEFLELVYQNHIQVKQKDGTHLFFTSEPHRTSAGIRVALTLYNVTLLHMQEW